MRTIRLFLLALGALAAACTSRLATPVVYVQDPSFPQTSSAFGEVSWVTFDAASNNVPPQKWVRQEH